MRRTTSSGVVFRPPTLDISHDRRSGDKRSMIALSHELGGPASYTRRRWPDMTNAVVIALSIFVLPPNRIGYASQTLFRTCAASAALSCGKKRP